MKIALSLARLVLLLGIVGLASTALSQEDFFIRTSLMSEQVVPAISSGASGQVTAVLVDDVLVVVGDYQDLSSPIDRLVAGGAHIHQATKGETGGIVFNLNNDGGMQGTFTGIFTLTNEQIQALKDGQYYVQLHTEANQPGELRGQLASNVSVADLVGVWDVAAGAFYTEFKADGSMVGAPSVSGLGTACSSCVEGKYELAGTLLQLRETSGNRCVTEEPGSYQVSLTESAEIKAVLHEDKACPARAGELTRGSPWVRVSP